MPYGNFTVSGLADGLVDRGVDVTSSFWAVGGDLLYLIVIAILLAWFLSKVGLLPVRGDSEGSSDEVEEVEQLVEEHPTLASPSAMREYLKYKRERDWVEQLKKSDGIK